MKPPVITGNFTWHAYCNGARRPPKDTQLMKKRTNANNPNTNNRKFIPTRKKWVTLLEKYKAQIVQSLWRSGNLQDREDAVMSAMGKILGLDPDHKLEKPLTPKTELQWVVFIKEQARSFLSHAHEHDAKWKWAGNTHEELSDAYEAALADRTLKGDARKDRLRNIQRQAMCMVDMEGIHNFDAWLPTEHLDAKILRMAVRIMVDLVCGKCGVSVRDQKAFVRFVLDGEEAKDVADELFKGKRDHLYIAVHRVNAKLLKHGRKVFGRSLALAEKKLGIQGA